MKYFLEVTDLLIAIIKLISSIFPFSSGFHCIWIAEAYLFPIIMRERTRHALPSMCTEIEKLRKVKRKKKNCKIPIEFESSTKRENIVIRYRILLIKKLHSHRKCNRKKMIWLSVKTPKIMQRLTNTPSPLKK